MLQSGLFAVSKIIGNHIASAVIAFDQASSGVDQFGVDLGSWIPCGFRQPLRFVELLFSDDSGVLAVKDFNIIVPFSDLHKLAKVFIVFLDGSAFPPGYFSNIDWIC
jgi:hypothetical protein